MKFLKLSEEIVKYFVDEKNKTITAVVENIVVPRCNKQFKLARPDKSKIHDEFAFRYSFTGKGTAKCSDEDTWDEAFGKKLAYVKAKKQIMSKASEYCTSFANQLQSLYLEFNSEASRYKAASASESNEIEYLKTNYKADDSSENKSSDSTSNS